MSLMYENNLLNEFLYKRNLTNSDKCPNCDNGVHTAHHILFECNNIPEEQRELAFSYLAESIGHDQAAIQSPTTILMGSRCLEFIRVCKDIVDSMDMRDTIEL